MKHVAIVIVGRHQIALVDFGHPGERIHILDNRPLAREMRFAILQDGNADNLLKWLAFGNFLDGEIELGITDKVDYRGRLDRHLVVDGNMRAAETDQQVRVLFLKRFRDPAWRRRFRARQRPRRDG